MGAHGWFFHRRRKAVALSDPQHNQQPVPLSSHPLIAIPRFGSCK